jgi:DNA-binding LacI/PurR family transcriptional regulator
MKAKARGKVTAPMTARVTMADIATAADVSIPTVSKVLNGRADVASRTRVRVEAMLRDFSYSRTPRRRVQRAGIVDLVFVELSPWATEIIRGAEEAASTAKYRIAVSALADGVKQDRWLNSVCSSRTDGVVLVLTELSPAHRERLAALHVPIVILDPIGQPDPQMPSIGAANWAGGLTATGYLVGLGHRRIGTITGPPAVLCSRARLDGYRAALERAGIPYDGGLVKTGDFRHGSGFTAATSLFKLSDRPTAIFAGSDAQALGVYEAARQHNLRIPEDLSVIGFDDLPMAEWVSPPLTTMHQPLAEMASLAMRTLLGGRPEGLNHRIELSVRLVVRASTAPIRSSATRRHIPSD